ncbi:MAG: TolC family protein [candidate division Zixibacteria bacterium]|nr:TolC family protein [candidate division Zixibacteria bacterium]
MRHMILAVFGIVVIAFGVARGETILTVDEVCRLALEYNRQYLAAERELDRARGDIIAARAGALPQVSIDGRYTRNIKKGEMFLPGEFFDADGFVKVPVSQNNDFNLSFSLTQPLYVGGKVGSAIQIASIYENYSREKVREVEADIIYNAEALFYASILAESNLDVLEKAYEQFSYNYETVEKFHSQGMASEFELLRARVEKSNLEPQLVGARTVLNITQKSLKSFLGLSLDEPVTLQTEITDTTAVNVPSLDSLTAAALRNRPEIKQAELQKRGYDKAVRIARGDWLYPTIRLNTSYDISASSEDFSLGSQDITKSWTASLLLTIPVFDGGRTIGEVRKAWVDYYQAMLAEQQAQDDIRLEVEQAHDNLVQARTALDVQKETIVQAEEGLRIANLRYESGVGTLLEVLSAQTALTDARTNMADAIYQYRLAKSALKKATGIEI